MERLCVDLIRAKEITKGKYVGEERPNPSLFQLDQSPFWWYFLQTAFGRRLDELDTAGLELEGLAKRQLPRTAWKKYYGSVLNRKGIICLDLSVMNFQKTPLM